MKKKENDIIIASKIGWELFSTYMERKTIKGDIEYLEKMYPDFYDIVPEAKVYIEKGVSNNE